jgi:hypothetical protein
LYPLRVSILQMRLLKRVFFFWWSCLSYRVSAIPAEWLGLQGRPFVVYLTAGFT